MEIKEFIENFAEQFDETDSAVFSANTDFKNLDEWSSLNALAIIAMVDEKYDVVLKGEDLRNAKTIEDVFNIVMSNK